MTNLLKAIMDTNEYLQSALNLAIENKNTKQIQGLIIAGADINQCDPYGSPMKKAAVQGDYNVLKNLLEGGGNPHNPEICGTPFFSLLFYLDHAGKQNPKAAKIIELFLEHGAVVDLDSPAISPQLLPLIKKIYEEKLIGV